MRIGVIGAARITAEVLIQPARTVGEAERPSGTGGVLAGLEAAGLVTLADKGYQGAAHAKIPCRGENKPESQKQVNKVHVKLRSPGAKAIHVLQIRET